ncbi:MAG: hypothetical protein U0905_11870 [Pirellulales bacterium]
MIQMVLPPNDIKANAIPETVIIDREGVVRYVFVGGGPKFQEAVSICLGKGVTKVQLIT